MKRLAFILMVAGAVACDGGGAGGSGGSAGGSGGSGGTAGSGGTGGGAGGGGGGTGGAGGGGGPECGNNVQEAGELCDGTDLAGNDCADANPASIGGTLACAANCHGFNASGCIVPDCGNNNVEPGELCDGTDLNGITCTALGYLGGNPTCAVDCTGVSTASCQGACGNGVWDGADQCDGTDFGPLDGTCAGSGLGAGNLDCNADCTIDTSACATQPACDGGSTDPGEDCDGDTNVNCADLGIYDGGTMDCAGDCTWDTSTCTGGPVACGNGDAETGEQCDGTDLGAGVTDCTDIGLGYTSGTLTCVAAGAPGQCTYNKSNCSYPECGDGDVNTATELCDGSDLDGATCAEVGDFTGGTLACKADCTFDTRGCSGGLDPACTAQQEGFTRCNGTVLETCNAGFWGNPDDCAPQICNELGPGVAVCEEAAAEVVDGRYCGFANTDCEQGSVCAEGSHCAPTCTSSASCGADKYCETVSPVISDSVCLDVAGQFAECVPGAAAGACEAGMSCTPAGVGYLALITEGNPEGLPGGGYRCMEGCDPDNAGTTTGCTPLDDGNGGTVPATCSPVTAGTAGNWLFSSFYNDGWEVSATTCTPRVCSNDNTIACPLDIAALHCGQTGSCSVAATACALDSDCPAGQTCVGAATCIDQPDTCQEDLGPGYRCIATEADTEGLPVFKCARPMTNCGVELPVLTDTSGAGDIPDAMQAALDGGMTCNDLSTGFVCGQPGVDAAGNPSTAIVECIPGNSGYVFFDETFCASTGEACVGDTDCPNADCGPRNETGRCRATGAPCDPTHVPAQCAAGDICDTPNAECTDNTDCLPLGGSCISFQSGDLCGWLPGTCWSFCESADGLQEYTCPAGLVCDVPGTPGQYAFNVFSVLPVFQFDETGAQIQCPVGDECDAAAGFICGDFYTQGFFCMRPRKVCQQ